MSEEIKKPRQVNKNRVTLTEDCSNRLGQWEAQIGETLRGVSVRSSDLVEWLVMGHSTELTPDELHDLQQKFWDDIAVASWALRELKRAKASGQTLSLDQVLGQSIQTVPGQRPAIQPRASSPFKRKENRKTAEKEEPDMRGEV